ncbi:MAG: ribosome biogenesis GTPase RsgA [SAR86 cluster bacterium]|uniref:Small ribosomal subunit biogenesis GTPase RsgA n=1 Tax=SAR86 cluster bacterium TaxID=2030880 RepID=A0A2A5B8I8_9GAMM|nr:MAG: ribosome biogenesis GTPase RsgA [SAR86 cluster bacterium]
MTKRRLSKHQLARISENQQKELVGSAGLSASDDATSLEKCNGRVISHFGKQVDVESMDPKQNGRIVRCHQRANLPRLVTGDLVVWEEEGVDSGVVLALGARRNLFGRPNSSGVFKPVAANIDLVLVVFASSPMPHVSLIDRYLVAIENLQLQAMLILNKSDLLKEEDVIDMDNMLSNYEKIGYALHKVSAEDGNGIDQLEQSLAGKTTILVGQSGVGKSSLINRLGLDAIAEVGPLSQTRDTGTHTTTTSRLFHLRSCDLIDSPGIREFGLGHIDQQQVFDGFIELKPLSGHCKFRDCSHRIEPGCAVQLAREKGDISHARVESYFRIVDSIENPEH